MIEPAATQAAPPTALLLSQLRPGAEGRVTGVQGDPAVVRPTLEVVLTESPAHLRKSFRPEYGLALIDLGA